MADLKSFYFDLALGGSSTVLELLINWAPRDHVLYGFDLPFAGWHWRPLDLFPRLQLHDQRLE